MATHAHAPEGKRNGCVAWSTAARGSYSVIAAVNTIDQSPFVLAAVITEKQPHAAGPPRIIRPPGRARRHCAGTATSNECTAHMLVVMVVATVVVVLGDTDEVALQYQ